MMNYKDEIATFIMPHYRVENVKSKIYFDGALKSIFNQTDTNWHIVIIDDYSPCVEVKDYLNKIAKDYPDKITVIFKDINEGAGIARNHGVKWAFEHNSPFILYNDADDISHSKRLEVVRKVFAEDPEASLVYSTFEVIDEVGRKVPRNCITKSILEILDSHENKPIEGVEAWIKIGTEKGYTNATSGTAVKTEQAFKYPFPNERVSEDSHTWMRYSAGGGKFVYCPHIPFLYRIPMNVEGSSSRKREGGKHSFYAQKARVDEDGFKKAMEISIKKGRIDPNQTESLMVKFYNRLSETLTMENEFDLAMEQIIKASEILGE